MEEQVVNWKEIKEDYIGGFRQKEQKKDML